LCVILVFQKTTKLSEANNIQTVRHGRGLDYKGISIGSKSFLASCVSRGENNALKFDFLRIYYGLMDCSHLIFSKLEIHFCRTVV